MSEPRLLHLLDATGASRTETYDGREHLVVPVVALIGDNLIHAVNAPSAEFVPASVLNASGWDGRPLMLGHPAKDGRQISANDPRVMERQGFGFMSASKMNGKRLGTEAWIDVAKLEKLGAAKMLEDLRAGKPVEVSVGAFVQTRDVVGKPYKTEWASIAPDHLAFLPDSVGACSREMGCGANRAAMRVCGDALELEAPVKKSISERLREWQPKALGALILKALDAEEAPLKENDDPDEQAEDISYASIKELITQAKASLTAGETHIDALIAENGKGDDEGIEDAHLEALVAMCVQLYGTTNGVIKMATACLAPDGATSPMAYMEQRAAAGARHNKADQAIIQDTHDKMVQLGADCSEMKGAESGELPGIIDGDDVVSATGGVQFRAACGCEGANMKRTESVQTILTLAAKAVSKTLADFQKTDGFSEEQVKGLNMVPEKTLESLATLAAKSPADAMIQAKHNADTAIAAHGHAMNVQDENESAKKAAADKKKADDAKASKDDPDADADDDSKDVKAAKANRRELKAAQAAGLSLEEYQEQEWLKTAPKRFRDMAENDKATKAARKAELIKALEGGPKTVKQLEALPVEELETLAAYAGIKLKDDVDYSGRGLPRAAEGNDDVYRNPPNGYDEAIKRAKATH